MTETQTLQTRRFLRKDHFNEEFDRLVTPGRSTTLREKARLMDMPPGSLSQMVNGIRPVNGNLVLALARLLPDGADLDAFFRDDTISVSRTGGRRKALVTAPAAKAA